jgi:hypothetical protein
MVNPAGSNRKPRKRRYVTISGGIIGSAWILSRVNVTIEGFLIQTQFPFSVIQHAIIPNKSQGASGNWETTLPVQERLFMDFKIQSIYPFSSKVFSGMVRMSIKEINIVRAPMTNIHLSPISRESRIARIPWSKSIGPLSPRL